MAYVVTRSSVLAIMKETTEGTPVAPAAGTDFVALQDNFTLTPSFNSLENAELRSSIGATKPIQGSEAPTASLSHYVRASGVEGQAPNYGKLLEAAFGAVSIAAAEYDTVASSTVAQIKVNTGEGATFERGEALLIKDGTNGYRIRCIDSVSGDNLNIGFELPVAPAAGVNLGKAVLYKPVNTGHPSLTLWHFLGNGGAIQMIAGARVTSYSVDIQAQELINATYSIDGVSYSWNPVSILVTDQKLDFTDDGGAHAATVAIGYYKDPYDLAAAIQSAMNLVSNLGYVVTYSDTTGRFKIAGTGTLLSLLFLTGPNTANTIADRIGFTTTDHTGATPTAGYTSDSPMSWTAPYTPSFDNSDPLVAKDNEIMVGGPDDYACFNASSVTFTLEDTKSDILSVCAVSGKRGSVVTARAVTISVSALLQQNAVENFKNFRSNDEVKFQYSYGVKTGGNWVPGKCGALYVPTAVITSYSISDADGSAQLDLELAAFVNSTGDGEAYQNFL